MRTQPRPTARITRWRGLWWATCGRNGVTFKFPFSGVVEAVKWARARGYRADWGQTTFCDVE
jgi:hypothetical protein